MPRNTQIWFASPSRQPSKWMEHVLGPNPSNCIAQCKVVSIASNGSTSIQPHQSATQIQYGQSLSLIDPANITLASRQIRRRVSSLWQVSVTLCACLLSGYLCVCASTVSLPSGLPRHFSNSIRWAINTLVQAFEWFGGRERKTLTSSHTRHWELDFTHYHQLNFWMCRFKF